MERGSDKHAPRLDEQLDHDTRSLRQGAPVEARAEEWREQEGPGDGEPVPDARLHGDRREESREGLGPDELEARADLARYLQGRAFPGDRDALIDSARELHAPDVIVARLRQLPDGTYDHFEAVWEALGGQVEFRS